MDIFAIFVVTNIFNIVVTMFVDDSIYRRGDKTALIIVSAIWMNQWWIPAKAGIQRGMVDPLAMCGGGC